MYSDTVEGGVQICTTLKMRVRLNSPVLHVVPLLLLMKNNSNWGHLLQVSHFPADGCHEYLSIYLLYVIYMINACDNRCGASYVDYVRMCVSPTAPPMVQGHENSTR